MGKSNVVELHPWRTTYDVRKEKEKNSIGERISAARHQRHLSQAKFCSILLEYGIDIGTAGLSKWEIGRSIPNAYQLLAIAHALGVEDDLTYFIPGREDLNAEGQQKLSDYKADLIASGRYKPAEPQKMIRMIEMPVSDLRASAGTGNYLDEGQFEMVSYPEAQIPKGATFGVYVSGDSMEPVYHDGQIVWVKECEELSPGDVGIFFYDGNGYIKSYDEKEPDAEDAENYTDSYGAVHKQPILISFNTKYAPIEISPNIEFRVIGKVL